MKCPKCDAKLYFVCNNPKCVCRTRVPEGEKPMEYVGDDAEACPYCGFVAHIDYWTELEMEQANNEVTK